MPTGVFLLCIPNPSSPTSSFALPYVGPIAFAMRMLGGRDIALATLFYTRQASDSKGDNRRKDPDPDRSAILKQALAAGIRADSLDVVAHLRCYGEGALGAEGRGWGILSCRLWGCWGHRCW
jgi:hypothetical protein